MLAIDIDDGRRGLAQLQREIQGAWVDRPGLENTILGFPDDFKNGVAVALPKTMTIQTPSGNEQRVYRVHRADDADAIIGCRLDTSLELKAASREGAPISGRLPPTFRPGTD